MASWVYSLAGDESEAGAAREQVIRLVGPGEYQNTINVRLHEAVAMVAAGGVDQGVRTAAEIIDGVPVAYRSHMIIETGQLVLRIVPTDQSARPAVTELREVLVRTPVPLS